MFFPPGSLPHGPKVDTKKALVLLDLQNDFLTPGGRLPVQNTATFVPKLPALVKKFREEGQVIWIQTSYRQPCPAISSQTGGYSILLKSLVEHLKQNPNVDDENYESSTAEFPSANMDDAEAFLSSSLPDSFKRCCEPNTKGWELPPVLASAMDKKKDLVFTKSQYSAFTDPMLVLQLRARLISDLYICGSLSNISVYATVLDAVPQGFNVTLIEDCLGFQDDSCHVEAMRQMADVFGVNGIDYQELMDDLHGLLGDVIPASKYTRKFQLSSQSERGPRRQLTHAQKVSKWMESMDYTDSEVEESQPTVENVRNTSSVLASQSLAEQAQPLKHDSPTPSLSRRIAPTYSPPRKRSTSDLDELESNDEDNQKVELSQKSSFRLTSPRRYSVDRSGVKKSKKDPAERTTEENSAQTPGQSKSTDQLPTSPKSVQQGQRAMSEPNALAVTQSASSVPVSKKKSKKYDPTYLDQNDAIGEGDTKIIHNVLGSNEAENAFTKLKANTTWQKMYHRTGEVPRLVAVQGTVDHDGSIPIYRHPADESPPLLPFDETVDWLRSNCETLVQHQLNHVLIQYYRSGEDNISEHSDKTLDIIPGSSIVNLSLGAMRTMTLRTKKILTSNPSVVPIAEGASRTTQRIRLAHNSAFILGQRTNANWLHAIRADKRPGVEKSSEELDYGGERISLTFRHIGTFIDPEKQLIWGQGATRKTKADANKILTGAEAERVGEQMIIGFGKENREMNHDFNREEVYGSGFDVVNFEVKPNTNTG
ncbi:hypothetical protein H2198_000903 [Neophaeococcomyces mojaviensis]|uniref:Uncharacterized protein n=1 Tax=Neophaeococcomyces mojaviensis TaxID=3383035 RepID=A0ACC3AJC9_9EURO|nr:hypothetical protein H2198_000903 [Knufia sp. JES_112]